MASWEHLGVLYDTIKPNSIIHPYIMSCTGAGATSTSATSRPSFLACFTIYQTQNITTFGCRYDVNISDIQAIILPHAGDQDWTKTDGRWAPWRADGLDAPLRNPGTAQLEQEVEVQVTLLFVVLLLPAGVFCWPLFGHRHAA